MRRNRSPMQDKQTDQDEGKIEQRSIDEGIIRCAVVFCFPFFATQVFSPSVYVDVALQKQLEELLNSCYYIPSKEEASKVEVISC